MERNEKIADLDNGLQVWSLVVSQLKEQDINAQVMDERRMKILTANIKQRGTLESLPYVHKKGEIFSIISGHHRVRAANNAGLKKVYCLVDTNELSLSQITSKQIAHNELVGTADSEILGQLVQQMKQVDDIIASGLSEKFINGIKAEAPNIKLPQLAFDWRIVTLSFLPNQLEDFDKLIKAIDSKTELIGVADRKQFDEFTKAVVALGRTKNIKSVAATINYLTKRALEEIEKDGKERETK